MKRREEREIARRLAGQPAGAPPADLLSRLKSDVPGTVAVGEEAAARRRPAALDRRWLVAASLAAMLGGGLLSLRVMQRTPLPASLPKAAAPAAPAPSAVAAPPALAPRPSREATVHRLFDQLAPSRRNEDKKLRAAAEPSPSAPPAASAGGLSRLDEESATKAGAERDGAPAERRLDDAGRLRKREEAGKSAAPPPAQVPKPAAPPAGAAGGFVAPPPVPAPPAAAERAAEAGPITAYAEKRLEAGLQRAQPQGAGAKTDAPAEAAPAGSAADEVEDFASSYDTDPAADRAGWSIAAGGTPLPPPVAGHAARPALGTRWVRFRLRAASPAPAGAARVEIAWSSGVIVRRRLGGRPATGETATAPDVYTLAPAVLRRGWTAVYEVRFAPRFAPDTGRGPDERLATIRVRPLDPARGPAPRELSLTAADFAPAWMDAAPALRLSCLAAAFAERRILDPGGDLADLLAATRSLAAETGDRRANDLVVRMLGAQRPSPAGPP